MLNNKTVAVVVPAYNEEKQIGHVIESMPDFVDRIIVVNDCSTDGTEDVVKWYISRGIKTKRIERKKKKNIKETKYNKAEIIAEKICNAELKFFTPSEIFNKNTDDDKIILIKHLKNARKGSTIATGYQWCREHNIDCIAIMDGDGQMDPDELESICVPIVKDDIDYVKGNRLIHKSAYMIIPKIRYLGNSILSMMTKIASGYWHISDTQCGYTAISKRALENLQIHKMYNDYGVYNDILVKLNISYCTIKEIEIKPVYNIGEVSKMKIWKVIPSLFFLLFRLFFYRMWKKYFFRDFHPIFLFYHFAILLFAINIPFIIKIIDRLLRIKDIPTTTLFAFVFLSISLFQAIFFAMWMDIQDNERLDKSLER